MTAREVVDRLVVAMESWQLSTDERALRLQLKHTYLGLVSRWRRQHILLPPAHLVYATEECCPQSLGGQRGDLGSCGNGRDCVPPLRGALRPLG
jgi:hypothetical protein